MLRRLLANVFLGFAALAICFSIAEVAFRLRGERVAKSNYPLTRSDFYVCWSSNEGGVFPIDLHRETDRAMLLRVLPKGNEELQKLAMETPYCLRHAVEERRRGPHPERPHAAALIG